MTNPDPEKKIRTYVGRRLEGKKLVHFFRDAHGEQGQRETWSYPKAKSSAFLGARIGYNYDLTDGLPPVWGDVEQGRKSDQASLAWQALDAAASMQLQETRINPSERLTSIISELHSARKLLGNPQRNAFDAWVLKELRKGS